ncbi:hypothetical protein B9Z55_005714 [Caenorhabditis nigoni]|uniref:Secreted protein n=1 Tax=Caenorhabditis nigoni TaxID=1611254 RepID=A0A2G5V239_9PELO|nr:hypothetical protein B9Z55_005714 [Caenorhabditis nigoni]
MLLALLFVLQQHLVVQLPVSASGLFVSTGCGGYQLLPEVPPLQTSLQFLAHRVDRGRPLISKFLRFLYQSIQNFGSGRKLSWTMVRKSLVLKIYVKNMPKKST